MSRSAFSAYVTLTIFGGFWAYSQEAMNRGDEELLSESRMMIGMHTAAQERSKIGCIISTAVFYIAIRRLPCIYLIDETYD